MHGLAIINILVVRLPACGTQASHFPSLSRNIICKMQKRIPAITIVSPVSVTGYMWLVTETSLLVVCGHDGDLCHEGNVQIGKQSCTGEGLLGIQSKREGSRSPWGAVHGQHVAAVITARAWGLFPWVLSWQSQFPRDFSKPAKRENSPEGGMGPPASRQIQTPKPRTWLSRYPRLHWPLSPWLPATKGKRGMPLRALWPRDSSWLNQSRFSVSLPAFLEHCAC